MIWEAKIIVYQEVEAETYEEACTIAEELFKFTTHYEDFEVANAYPKEEECFEPGRPVNDIMALNP